MTNDWSFGSFCAWVSFNAEILRQKGLAVDFQHQEGESPTVRLRIENTSKVGELVVWSDGKAYEAVIDLMLGKYVHERDNVYLTGEWCRQLETFFWALEVYLCA